MNGNTHRLRRPRHAGRRSLAAIGLVVTVAMSTAATAVVRAALYAATDAGLLFESMDDGPTWTLKGSLAEPEVVALSPGLASGTLYALGRAGSLHRSTSAGAAWSAVGNAGASDCVSLATARDGALLALTQSGDVSRSSDGGATWARESNVGASDCAALVVGGGAVASDTLFVATSSGDVTRSPGTTTWTRVGSTSFTPIVDLLWFGAALYALTDAGEVLRSTDAGVAWTAIGTISQVGMRDLAFVAASFKAISREGEVFESASGASWSANAIGTTNQVFTVAFSPGVPEFLTGIGGAAPAPFTFEIRPSVFRDHASFLLSGAPQERTAEIEVFDTSGRRMARLRTLVGGPPAEWDGRLPDGTRAASGVYFARVTSGSWRDTARLVLVR